MKIVRRLNTMSKHQHDVFLIRDGLDWGYSWEVLDRTRDGSPGLAEGAPGGVGVVNKRGKVMIYDY